MFLVIFVIIIIQIIFDAQKKRTKLPELWGVD